LGAQLACACFHPLARRRRPAGCAHTVPASGCLVLGEAHVYRMTAPTPHGPQAAALANRAQMLQQRAKIALGLPQVARACNNPRPGWRQPATRRLVTATVPGLRVRATPAAIGGNPQQPRPGHCNQVPYVSDDIIHYHGTVYDHCTIGAHKTT
jgi:hypothetical protein